MNVLVVSEGSSELGDMEHSGALIEIVARILGEMPTCTTLPIKDDRFRGHRGKGDGYWKRALACLRYATRQGFDALILVVDEDGDTTRHKQFDDAQSDDTFPVKRALGVAVRMFDAWWLADEVAMRRVLERDVQRQPDPERIADPKAHWEQLCPEERSMARLYADLAKSATIDVIETRCPRGFAPFAERVRELV